MASQPIRDAATDHLLTPKNSAMLIIDYQPVQVNSIAIDRPLRVAYELESGTVWVNDWGSLYDQFEEGGFKQSGQGRMRGLAVMEDFFEYKHIVLRPGSVHEGRST